MFTRYVRNTIPASHFLHIQLHVADMMDCDIIDCDIISNYPTELHESVKPERDNHIHGTYLILKPKFRDHFDQFFPNSNPHMMPNRVLKFDEVALQYPYLRCIRELVNILDGE